MSRKTNLSDSLEDYLEAIVNIVREKQAARAKDISMRLGVNAPSVTAALRALAERGLINYAPYDIITLTPKGKRLGKDVVHRHEALRDFFVRILSIDSDVANKAACKMEHAIPQEVLDGLIRFVEFAERCPRSESKWIEGFQNYCKDRQIPKVCKQCVGQSADGEKPKAP